MAMPIALYYLTNGTSADADHPAQMVKRPDASLVWLHAPRPADAPIVQDLTTQLAERNPDLWFLVTTHNPEPAGWPNRCICQTVPTDTKQAVARFIAHWSPDVAVWLSDELRPGLITETARSNVPLYMLDTGNAHAAAQFKSRIPGLRKSVLRQFTTILAGDAATAQAFIHAGANEGRVRTVGVLERGIRTLHCLEAERDTLAELFAARPVWLAAELHPDEFDPVLEAHATALRRTHRLLLIIVPQSAADGSKLAELLMRRDMSFEMRSKGAEPEAETQVYVADTDNEMGLWYRLAPTSFLGRSLVDDDSAGPHPFHAAALGSVVLHGSQTRHHRDAFLRLKRAGASREVANATDLANEIDALLAPDKAAEMAHAAWQVCSAGAEVTDLVLELILGAVATPKVRA